MVTMVGRSAGAVAEAAAVVIEVEAAVASGVAEPAGAGDHRS